jgi:RNA polymerase sigma-70 factor (ECF subfamily)
MEPSHRMELAEFRDALENALGKLPVRIAQVFQLYEVEERPNREVCARLNISENNLWVMLHRARKQLQQHLGDWWQAAQPRQSSGAPAMAETVSRENEQPSISLN